MHRQHLGERNILHQRQPDVEDYARPFLQRRNHSGRKRTNLPRVKSAGQHRFARQRKHRHPQSRLGGHESPRGFARAAADEQFLAGAVRRWGTGDASFNSAPKNSAPPAISHRLLRRVAQVRTSSALAASPMTIPRSGRDSPHFPTEIGSADGLPSNSSTFGDKRGCFGSRANSVW